MRIEYKPFTHGKNYEYADYTEITVTFDGYNVTYKLQVKYNFIKSVYVGRTGDSYRVYYKRENGEKDDSRPYSMNEATDWYFEDETVENVAKTVPYLANVYKIKLDHIIMHGDASGKLCPQPYTYQPEGDKRWEDFKEKVAEYMNRGVIVKWK